MNRRSFLKTAMASLAVTFPAFSWFGRNKVADSRSKWLETKTYHFSYSEPKQFKLGHIWLRNSKGRDLVCWSRSEDEEYTYTEKGWVKT